MKAKWLILLWMFAMLVLVSPIQHAIASTNVSGGIDYTKSQLTPTLEQGAKKNPPNNNGGGGGGGGKGNGEEEDDRPWWEKAVDVVVDKVKKGTETVVETVKDAGEYISDKTSEIVDATTEWWNERSLLEKSLIIVGVIATVVTLGAAAGVISAGAALTMGVMGAANYALYAATTDNVSFWGGLMWGGLGMVGGGIGLAAKGTKFLAPARAALSSGKAAVVGRLGALVPAAVKGSRFYPMIASAARTIIPGMMKGAVAGSGLAVYTHMAKWAITGETPNWGDVARDAMIWGASGAVAGGMFKPVTNVASKFVSKGKAMVAGASSSAGSESVVSDWLEGKNIDLKKAAIAASAVVVLGGAGVLATQMTNKSVKQVASTTELATDTAKVAKADDGVQGGKTTAPGTDLSSNDPYNLLKQNGIPQTFSDNQIAALKAADMRMELQGQTNNSISQRESQKLNYQPTSGVILKSSPEVTTTILGNYANDMSYIVKEMGNIKSTDFGPRIGGFNVLNVPDDLYVHPKQFWEEYNQPWLDNAVSRGDEIIMATKPEFGPDTLLFRRNFNTKKLELTGFGKEYYHLRKNGYILDPKTMKMVPKSKVETNE